MIVKSFELNKIKTDNNFYLFYGENEGHKNEAIDKNFKKKFQKNIYHYEEKEILENDENFFNSILSKSLFEDEKLIIISRVSDKIHNIMGEIIEKKTDGIKIILNASILEKKSKIRSLFEKSQNTICVPFYADNHQTLNLIVNNFFNIRKIPISQQTINILIDRSRGDRQNLKMN